MTKALEQNGIEQGRLKEMKGEIEINMYWDRKIKRNRVKGQKMIEWVRI